MDEADRLAIEGLFDRIAALEQRSGPRDREAEALIADELRRLPAAPYYLAQTVLVQEQALFAAEERIRELEAKLARGSATTAEAFRRGVPQSDQARGPWERQPGFLAGAVQTALGVTGGVLLGSAIAGLLGAGATSAQAAEGGSGPEEVPEGEAGPEGDFFDDSGFDFGGDF